MISVKIKSEHYSRREEKKDEKFSLDVVGVV